MCFYSFKCHLSELLHYNVAHTVELLQIKAATGEPHVNRKRDNLCMFKVVQY